MEEIKPGTLYLVSTPIGNLADITYRAVEILKRVDLIAAEDTRKSGVLLKHYGIRTSLRSYHSYNLKQETSRLVKTLKAGKSLALISDAGTPAISDPGYHLVRACVEEGIPMVPVPGASALLAALVASGLPCNRFVFEGFLPQKKGRKKRLQEIAQENRTVVLYESPHRIAKTVQELADLIGERPCVMARELTKKFETFFRGTLQELNEFLKQNPPKGEIVLVIQGTSK